MSINTVIDTDLMDNLNGDTPNDTPNGDTPNDTPNGDTPNDTPNGDTPNDTPNGDTPNDTPDFKTATVTVNVKSGEKVVFFKHAFKARLEKIDGKNRKWDHGEDSVRKQLDIGYSGMVTVRDDARYDALAKAYCNHYQLSDDDYHMLTGRREKGNGLSKFWKLAKTKAHNDLNALIADVDVDCEYHKEALESALFKFEFELKKYLEHANSEKMQAEQAEAYAAVETQAKETLELMGITSENPKYDDILQIQVSALLSK